MPGASWCDGGPAGGAVRCGAVRTAVRCCLRYCGAACGSYAAAVRRVVRGRRARTRGQEPLFGGAPAVRTLGNAVGRTAVAVPGAPAPPGRATPSGENRERPVTPSGDRPDAGGTPPDPGGEVAHPYNTPVGHWLSSLAGPGERWRMLAWHLPEPLASKEPRNLGASIEQGTQHPTRRSVRPDRMVEGRTRAAGQPSGCRDGADAPVHRHVEGTALDRAGGDPARSGAEGAGCRVHGAARTCRHH